MNTCLINKNSSNEMILLEHIADVEYFKNNNDDYFIKNVPFYLYTYLTKTPFNDFEIVNRLSSFLKQARLIEYEGVSDKIYITIDDEDFFDSKKLEELIFSELIEHAGLSNFFQGICLLDFTNISYGCFDSFKLILDIAYQLKTKIKFLFIYNKHNKFNDLIRLIHENSINVCFQSNFENSNIMYLQGLIKQLDLNLSNGAYSCLEKFIKEIEDKQCFMGSKTLDKIAFDMLALVKKEERVEITSKHIKQDIVNVYNTNSDFSINERKIGFGG